MPKCDSHLEVLLAVADVEVVQELDNVVAAQLQPTRYEFLLNHLNRIRRSNELLKRATPSTYSIQDYLRHLSVIFYPTINTHLPDFLDQAFSNHELLLPF